MSIVPRRPRDTPGDRATKGEHAVPLAPPTDAGGAGAAGEDREDSFRYRRRRAAERAEHRRAARLRRLLAAVLLLAVVTIAFVVALVPGGTRHGRSLTTSDSRQPPSHRQGAADRPTSYAVGLEVLRLVEPGRSVTFANGATEPRTLETYVRYPAQGPSQATDVAGAVPATADGPFPLVVFGPGFDQTTETYKALLQSWARAGFVVAAPAFPLENADAPGGPEESDLVNQPSDMSFVISRLLAESASGRGTLAGLVNPAEVAVSGHSDGGDTALAVGYSNCCRDARAKAVMVLSGAAGPFGGFQFSAGEPPLLATQGSADTINRPEETNAFFEAAREPKYLLTLEGASHLPPYTGEQPQLEIVERVTITFLKAYLEHKAAAQQRLRSAGDLPGIATLVAEAPSASR
jgi:dienelactone hydrolase